MEILLIGGTGVLSTAVSNEALKRGIRVTMINRGHSKIPANVTLIQANKDNLHYIASQLEGKLYDAVIDFLCYTDEQTTKSFNFYKNYTKQYFYISSCAVYDTRKGVECKEDSPKVLPIWKYSVDKWASEVHLQKLAAEAKKNYTIIRPCVTYGNTRIPYGIMPAYSYHWTLAARILAGKPIITWNNGENRCNMMRVEDFAVGVVGLIGNPKAYNEAFNVCGDETPTFRKVIDVVSEYLGKKAITIDVDKDFYANEISSRKGELLGGRCIDSINSNSKIKDAVPEFKQTILIKEGVKMTLDAYKLMIYQKGIDWTFDADTDRIIAKWCQKNNIEVSQYKLGFVDFLGNATSADKKTYKLIFYKDKGWSKLLIFFDKVFNRLKCL